MKEIFNMWKGIYNSFDEASNHAVGAGFNGDIRHTRSLKSAKESLEALKAKRSIPSFYKQCSTLLPPIAAMMLAGKEKIKIIDFGGRLGIGYLTLAESIPNAIDSIDYTIIEVPERCELGRELFEDDQVIFSDLLPQNGIFDMVHSSSALQYIEEWKGLLTKLSTHNAEYIFLSDVFASAILTFEILQNYCGSRIKHWFFNLEEFVSFLSTHGYEVIMQSFVSSRRLDLEDILPIDNFPESHRLSQSLHLLLHRIS